MHDRTKARRSAAQALYTSSIRNISIDTLIDQSALDCLDGTLSDYALALLSGVQEHRDELDEKLSTLSEKWTTDRMPVMDLNILRLALFEMLYMDDVPISVSINEAVELAKDFGGDDNSPKFVNGMLGTIARQMDHDVDAPETDPSDASSTDVGEADDGMDGDAHE